MIFPCIPAAETVLDPALTIRDHQDTMSGDPPSDITTKGPFEEVTESFTVDYEDTTLTLDESEGKGSLPSLACTASFKVNK